MDVPRCGAEHLRREAKKTKPEVLCPLCSLDVQTAEGPQNGSSSEAAFASFQGHLSDVHTELLVEKASKGEESTWIKVLWEVAQSSDQRCHQADFDRGTLQKGKLFDDTAAPRPRPYDKSNVAMYQRQRHSSGSGSKAPRQAHLPPARALAPPLPADDSPMEIIKLPETRSISQEQLVAEVKGTYAGLVMIESKCIEVDNAQREQNKGTANHLNNDQWQALIASHRTLLHEHHDFFLASQHPSASPALRRLAAKYAMPPRMWRHGIHSFLELLRHRLPATLDHMLTFIYMAYSMMALLYETVPAIEDTCMGDLGRYRMAIEDDDIRDREVWTAVSRHWYSRVSGPRAWEPDMAMPTAYQAKPNTIPEPSHHPSSRLPRGLLKLLRAFLPPLLLALLPLAASQPLIPYRASKILFVSASALTSLGTGMASLQLPPGPSRPDPNPNPNADPDRGTQLIRMYLRLVSLFFLGLLGVAYKLFFLPARDRQKTAAFLQAFCVLTGVCWVVVHPRWNAGSEDRKKGSGDDGLSWLDGVGLYGLVAVAGGMLFAEWWASRRGGEGADERRSGPGDEESQGADGGRGDATTTAVDSGAGGGDGEGADGRRRETDGEGSQGADGRRGGAAASTERDGGNAAESTSQLGQVAMSSLMNCLLGA
ncbi:hypothetical protein NEMBOFW57_000676 [Staphylotrichum longicolle]|uniref:Uncharacterized protein n=1 Tax=Staphylotrichum longicolle TaxID=669026 RepID=A0AAD4I355_9PEZI|nr:hypothetical protein NEMBOFW57_000676 [Staphylotrichum longicolle]